MVSSLVALWSLSSIFNTVGSTPSPVAAPGTTPTPSTGAGGIFAATDGGPTNSPVERSNLTILDDGGIHIINNQVTSFDHESIVVKDNTTLILEAGGYIKAPDSSDGLPALRFSIGAIFNGTGGLVVGSHASTTGGDNSDGEEAIEMFNGQSTPKTASVAYFYDGINVIGGDAPNGVGGKALHGK